MDIAKYIIRFLFKKKWWLLFSPIVAVLAAIVFTANLPKKYFSNSVIYTGVVSGYNIETSIDARVDIAQTNSQMENFLNIIHSYTTLKNVSLRLFTQHVCYGDTLFDTEYIMASHYEPIWNHIPQEIRNLIDRNSFDSTLANFQRINKNERDNFIYGLFMWNYSYYGKENLESIKVSRLTDSDMLEISYTADDPYVVYNTLLLLNSEFFYQYNIIRDNEANRAIEYFEAELERIAALLKAAEEDQKQFHIANKVINYEEQTKQMATLDANFRLKKQEIESSLHSSEKIIAELETKFGDNFNYIRNNTDIVNRINTISSLSNQIALSSVFQDTNLDDTSSGNISATLLAMKGDLKKSEEDLVKNINNFYEYSGTGQVLIPDDIAIEWLKAIVQNEKAKSDVKLLDSIKNDISNLYNNYSPVGIYLQQKQRMISFLEKEYFSALDNLNDAKKRKKNTQMSAANLKVITPPQLPLEAEPNKRMYIILGAGMATLILLLGIFILAELVSTTIRDKDRAERLTGGKVIGAIPKKYKYKYKKYNDEYLYSAILNLSNSILNRIRFKDKNIVNFISFSHNSGKTVIINNIANYWNTIGRRYRIVNWKDAYDRNDREVMYPINLNDLLSFGTDRVLLVEHRDLKNEIIQKEILQSAIINILILDVNSSWKDTDKNNYKNLLELLGDKSSSLVICLNNAEKFAVEDFTDQLPPFNFLSNLSHSIYNYGN